MLAVAGFVKGKEPAPPELVIGLNWKRFGIPYAVGGQRDQPIRLFGRMKLALTIYEALIEWKQKYTPTPEAEERWHQTHEWVVDIVSDIEKLRRSASKNADKGH